jgi:hypothetical protein
MNCRMSADFGRKSRAVDVTGLSVPAFYAGTKTKSLHCWRNKQALKVQLLSQYSPPEVFTQAIQAVQ